MSQRVGARAQVHDACCTGVGGVLRDSKKKKKKVMKT